MIDPYKLLKELTDIFYLQGYPREMAQKKAERVIHKCHRWVSA